MTGRFDTNRPDGEQLSADQRREWRRWVLETVTAGAGSVVPVGHLVETVAEREPDDTSRSTVRTALVTYVLPTVGFEPGLEYDAERQVVINYCDYYC